MKYDLVIDASVALCWCFPDERSTYADKILSELGEKQAIVPSLWAIELANSLLVGERRKRLTAADIANFLDILKDLQVDTDDESAPRALSDTWSLARRLGLSAYDGCYLELAMREGLPLATLDVQMKKAAKAAGVKIAA